MDIQQVFEVGRTYSWAELGAVFGFKPNYLSAAGGMIPRTSHGVLILITHPEGGKSFDYEDYWEGADLIYTGRGQKGDQVLTGPNGDVANNRLSLLIFSNVGTRQLRFLGSAKCTASWPARGPDVDGRDRVIYRFRLQFETSPAKSTEGQSNAPQSRRRPERSPRHFDPSRQIPTYQPSTSSEKPEERLVAQEKAARGHQQILVALHSWLVREGWTSIEEVPAALDLRAKQGGNGRVIFEAKTITPENEVHQCRAALSQLMEYRFFFGAEDDQLCLVVDRPVSDSRIRFLESVCVAVILADGTSLQGLGSMGVELLSSRSVAAKQ